MRNLSKSSGRQWLASLLIVLPLLSLTTLAQSTVTNGVVAYWNFDGKDFKDSVGQFDGTANGSSPIVFVDGKAGFGQAMKLDGPSGSGGSDQMVEIDAGDPDALAFEGGSMSIAGWFTVDSFDVSWQALIAKGESSNWRVHRAGSNPAMTYAGGIGEGPTDGPDVTDGNWHHFVAVTDANAVDFGAGLYLDGVLTSVNTGMPNLAANGKPVMIGENPDARNRYWHGKVDDIAIWNRVLTPAEVAALYAGGAGKPLSAFYSPVVDTDHDGMPDAWEIKYGLNPNDPTDAAKDCNNNGVSNLDEFKAGLDPCDTTKPTVILVAGNNTFDAAKLTFSELLDPATATNAANYTITPTLAVTAAAYKNGVVTLTTAKQTPGATYTVAIKGVTDLSKNAIAAGTTATLRSYVMTKSGLLKFSYWGDIPSTPLDGLIADPRYPATPDLVLPVYSLNSRDAFPDDSHENYGATIEGFLTPKVSASYNFFLRSDDAAQFWISTDESDTNLVMVAEEIGCCQPFLEPDPNITGWHDNGLGQGQTTLTPIPLVAGKKYFIRLLYKEGGGGDYGQVAWRTTTDTTAAGKLKPIPADFLSSAIDLPGPPPNQPAPQDISSGLVAYWNFDGNLFDSIKDFDGTGRGTNPPVFVAGKPGFGQSIKLDGTDQFIEITGGNENQLEFPNGSMSIAGWFKVDAFDKSWQALIAKGESSNYRVARRADGNSIAYAGGVGEGADDVPNVNDGQWHHFVAVSDTNRTAFGTALYVDGVLHGINTNKPVLTGNTAHLMIGENPEARGRYWKGQIDDIGIWNRVLTPAEISSLYASGTGTPLKALLPPSITLKDDLVAYWNFDGNLLDSVKDFDGTSRGTNPVVFVDGQPGFGKAIKLDGTDFVEITGGNENELEFPKGSMSIGGWFKVEAFDKSWQALVAKGEGSNYRVARRADGNSIAYAGGVGEGADDVPNVNDGKWHHFMAVSDTNRTAFGTALYVDGVLHGINTNKPVLTANSSHLMIGENPEARARQWKGQIDDIAIWSRVVTPAEISALYNGGQGMPISALGVSGGVPADFGQTVNGFQDDFTGATRDPNWQAFGPGGDRYEQMDGILYVSPSVGDPNHLLYMKPGYSNDVQEVLARIRVTAFQTNHDYPRGGIAVGVRTNTADLSRGLDLHFRDSSGQAVGGRNRHFRFLDDLRAWGPGFRPDLPTGDWANNTWYWMRMRLDKKADGTNDLFGKVWLADGLTPEPSAWQLKWQDTGVVGGVNPIPTNPLRAGYAGISGSSVDGSGNGLGHLEVDYILIKAAGLPQINVDFKRTAPAATVPEFIGITPTAGNKLQIDWIGAGTLESADTVTGPWTPVPAASAVGIITPTGTAKFYRLRQ